MADPRAIVNFAARNAAPAARLGMTAAVATGAYLAFSDARELYGSRTAMAGEFQQETTFPLDLIQDGIRNFYISFKFQAYEKRSINNSPFLRSVGTIRLPIPDNIKDNMSVSYTTANLGPAVGSVLDQLAGTPIASQDILGAAGTLAAQALPGVGAALAGGVAGALANGPGGQAAQSLFGMAVNPFQTVLFQNPEFKTHSFSWKIMPKNERESIAARDIFRTFQYHMSPGVSSQNGLFFSYPSMVAVSLYPSSEFLYRFKPCVIKSVSVDYSAGSAPSFFKRSDAPTSMSLTIDMQEIEYWTNRDFTAAAFNQIAAENRTARIERGTASASGASGGTV